MTSEPLDAVAESLRRAAGDWTSLRAAFAEHARGGFLTGFLVRELGAAAGDRDHVVRRGAGQASFTFLDTPDLEYSVRVIMPFSRAPRPVKWTGMPQAVAVKGPGTLLVRTLATPPGQDIEQFTTGVSLRQSGARAARDGDIVVNDDRHQILDVCEATGPVIAEILTYRRGAPHLIWTFGAELLSLYAEQSSLAASRFRNVLRIAELAGIAVPDDIYELAVASGSPQVALPAIRSMLAAGHPDSFVALQRAAESAEPALRQGANAILDALFAGSR